MATLVPRMATKKSRSVNGVDRRHEQEARPDGAGGRAGERPAASEDHAEHEPRGREAQHQERALGRRGPVDENADEAHDQEGAGDEQVAVGGAALLTRTGRPPITAAPARRPRRRRLRPRRGRTRTTSSPAPRIRAPPIDVQTVGSWPTRNTA